MLAVVLPQLLFSCLFFNLSSHVVCQRDALCACVCVWAAASAPPAAHLQICKLKMFCHADREKTA